MLETSAKNNINMILYTIQLALAGRYSCMPNPMVGAVIVKDNEIVGEGYHEKTGSAHAEINALNQAGDKAKNATLYLSLEPCCHQGRTPPCTQSIVDAGIQEVIIAMQDPNPKVSGLGIKILEAHGIRCHLVDSKLINHHRIQGSSGTLGKAVKQIAEEMNAGFIHRITKGTPWVQIKMAASLDGRIAMADGESKWITSKAARQEVQKMRLASCAILTSSKTLIEDNPRLSVRSEECEIPIQRQPDVVLLDSNLVCKPHHRIFEQLDHPRTVHIFTSIEQRETPEIKDLESAGALIHYCKKGPDNNLDLKEVLEVLGKREINRLFIESGGKLAGQFIQQKLVNELTLFFAPILLGHQAIPMFQLDNIKQLSDKVSLKLQQMEQIGEDMMLGFWANP